MGNIIFIMFFLNNKSENLNLIECLELLELIMIIFVFLRSVCRDFCFIYVEVLFIRIWL